MPLLIRTPETIELIHGLFDRLDIMKEAMGDTMSNVDNVNLNDLIDNFFRKINEDFAKAGDFPAVKLDDSTWATFAFLGDLTGIFFAYNGDERDTEFLKLLTEFFNQYNKGLEYDMEKSWKLVKESNLAY